MTALAEACADLEQWLTVARELITQPDTQPAAGRTAPSSTPPWNAQAANALLDAHAMARELEQNIRYQVTGTYQTRGGSDLNTARALAAISNLAEAIGPHEAGAYARLVERHVTTVMRLPAVDLEERSRIIPVACPRCGAAKLLLYERSGRIGCPACERRGWMVATVSDGCVQWEDGEIT